MSYQNYPGLAESPPPSAINKRVLRLVGTERRAYTVKMADFWVRLKNNDKIIEKATFFEEMSRHDSPASSAAFYRQSTATSTNNFQEHYSHGSNSSAVYFQEEFRGPFPTDSSLCAFPADFRSLHPRTKSRFDEIVDDGHGQPVPMSSDTADFRARRICGDAVGTEIQMGDQMAMVPTQSTPMEQPNCHQAA
ncbi:hypothetical protein niasHT_020276 [Heterodera trifolii]|uniref:Uncharacterized protein n=1 Tax=Heterodera trifolii TaxID=157864 RepID=A0ABD2JQL7_9BILA